MRGRGAVKLAAWAVLALLLLGLLAGALLGQPVVLGYVETESMSPTLEPGDGFLAVPPGLMGPIQPGDVVVFRATVIDGGGLTTHRVVGETEGGFLTRGDANVVTDQDSGEPPVTRERVVAEAVQVGGHVIVVPGVGAIAGGVQSLVAPVRPLGSNGHSVAFVLFAAGVVAYLWSAYGDRAEADGPGTRRRSRSDDSIDSRVAVLGTALVLGAVLTGSMLLTETTHEFGVVSAEQDSDRPYVIERGTTENVTYTVPSYGVLPAAVFLEPGGDDVEVEPRELYVPSGEVRNASVVLTAPPEIGHHPQYLTERRYLGLLPMGLIGWLYGIHPVAPVVVIDLLVGGGVVALGWVLFGSRRIRLDSRRPDRPLRYRLRRWLR